MKAAELYDEVTAKLIAKLEAGEAGTWTQSWTGSFGLPTNALTRKAYRGGNVIWFWMEAADKGYASNEWATWKQWNTKLGITPEQIAATDDTHVEPAVARGEKATYGIKWVFPTEQQVTKALAKGEKPPRAFPRSFAVFNAEQVRDGLYVPEVANPVDTIAHAEAFFAAQGARIVNGNPSYSPTTDAISLPPIDAFVDAEAYYATSAHEHTHRTGAESRLARDGIVKFDHFGSEQYAFEELIAELGAAFTAAHLGISTTPRPDHAAYLANWIKALKNDNKLLYRAASAAQKAVDYLIEQADGASITDTVDDELAGIVDLDIARVA